MVRKTHQDTPVLHNPNWGGIRTGGVLTGFEGFRATSGRRVLNNKCSTRPCGSMGTTSNPHQDTPVLHNSNWGGIRTGGVLTGFEGFRATSGRRVLNNYWSLWPSRSIGMVRKTHQDTPVLHNPNWKDIRMGGVLIGFEGFKESTIRIGQYCTTH